MAHSATPSDPAHGLLEAHASVREMSLYDAIPSRHLILYNKLATISEPSSFFRLSRQKSVCRESAQTDC